MDFKGLASDIGLDEEDFNELLEVFITQSFSDIEKINAGLKEKNAENVALSAHSIKGASANLGFKEIASISKNIEMTAKEGNVQGVEEQVNTIVKELKKIENAI